VYPCDCSRATFAAWSEAHGRAWSGPGCPGGCLERGLDARPALPLRAALGAGDEAWADLLLGARSGPVAIDGDLPVRDRNGNWTYAFCVVVDDIRHGVGLVVRGEDLADATPSQIRLARLLGRAEPPHFAHHPLIRRPDGSKLSKADAATSIADLLDGGRSPEELFAEVLEEVGLRHSSRPISLDEATALIG
jgi:glutamyl-tRNA synthetase